LRLLCGFAMRFGQTAGTGAAKNMLAKWMHPARSADGIASRAVVPPVAIINASLPEYRHISNIRQT